MIETPDSAKDVVTQIKTDVQREYPGSNPFYPRSLIAAIITGLGFRVFDVYLQLKRLARQFYLQTADEQNVAFFGDLYGVVRHPASKSGGFIAVSGTPGSTVPAGSELQAQGGEGYLSVSVASVASQSIAVSSITRTGDQATVTTTSPHGLGSSLLVTVTGADQIQYNVTDQGITVTGEYTFSYDVEGEPVTPATGTITASSDFASIEVESVGYGAEVNQVGGAQLTFVSPIAGVDTVAPTGYEGLVGGTDAEGVEDYRNRILDEVRAPIAHFNKSTVIKQARKIAGVTRVFVFEATPAPGQVSIYFTRDNDASIIPSGQEVTAVKDKILEIKPVIIDDADVIVASPTPVSVDFTFTALSPNTTTMQDAIRANLTALMRAAGSGDNVTQDSYRAAIQRTVDRESGDTVSSFTLSAPSGDITINPGEIPVVGTINF